MPHNFGTILLLCTNLHVVMQVHVCEMSGVSLQRYRTESPTCCAPQNQPVSCHAESKACQQTAERAGCCETESIDLRLEIPQQVSKILVVPTVAPLSPKITLDLLPKPAGFSAGAAHSGG